MEFRRTILQDICFVRSIVASDCASDADGYIFLSDIDRRLASGGGNYSSRSARRCFLITAAIKDQFLEARITKSELVEYLDLLIEQLEREFFVVEFEHIAPLLNTAVSILCVDVTGCQLTAKYPICKFARITCSRSQADCRLIAFIESNLARFVEISQAFMKVPPGQRDEKMIEAVGRLLGSSSTSIVLGQKNCWPLGDSIIAIEAPDDSEIYTKDQHFDVICHTLNKHRYLELT